MYMTGTDGVAVSAYAFDDFGRNINPFTGKVRNSRNNSASKHAYTTNGNIIQPFAFTGYQEDEVSGLKFAQARFYKAETGRFQSEDNVKGFINNPITLNHYGYCWNNPVVLVDNDGNLPRFITDTANKIQNGINAVESSAKACLENVSEYINDNKQVIGGVVSGVGMGVGIIVSLTGNPVLGGAIMGGASQLGETIAEKGTHIDGKDILKVWVGALAGAAGGAIGNISMTSNVAEYAVHVGLSTFTDVTEEVFYQGIDGKIDKKKLLTTAGTSLMKHTLFEGIGVISQKAIGKIRKGHAPVFDDNIIIDDEVAKLQGKITDEIESIAIHENYKLASSGPNSRMYKGAVRSIQESEKRIDKYYDKILALKNFGKWRTIGNAVDDTINTVIKDGIMGKYENWRTAYKNIKNNKECLA
jgi:RHS repeat-associated protein